VTVEGFDKSVAAELFASFPLKSGGASAGATIAGAEVKANNIVARVFFASSIADGSKQGNGKAYSQQYVTYRHCYQSLETLKY
jgi:hypothetical protein